MVRYFWTLILVLLIASCNNAPKSQDGLQVPQWYVNGAQNDQQSFYGIGSGSVIDDAKLSALNELQSRISTSISSATQVIKEENNDFAKSDFFQSIKSQIAEIEINNYIIDKSEKIGDDYFVQVKVDRVGFIKNLETKLNTIRIRNNANYRASRDNNIVNRKQTLELIVKRNQEAQRINYILLNIAKNHNFRKINDEIIDYEKKLAKINNQIEVFLELVNVPRNIQSALNKAINQSGIKITKRRNRQNDDLVIINIQSKASHRIIYNSNISKITLTFKIFSNKARLIATNQIEVSGSSLINKEEAVSAAIAQFNQEVKKKGILNIIGL